MLDDDSTTTTTTPPTPSASRPTDSTSASLTSSNASSTSSSSSLAHSSNTPANTAAPTLWSAIRSHGYQPHPNQPTKSFDNPSNSSIHSLLENIQKSLTEIDCFPPHFPNDHNNNNDNATNLTNFLAGTLAFYYTAMTSTYIQWKLLKISTGTRPAAIPAVLGA
eukprot:CAMPEP_0171391382 /NCGR_PEP_ID=MMETSP0880-20121228/1232_1 /TAXON_ID=67004 /ORGANISM="Thalassiosira weissflogii, Strain CCMP1336" /LENGTH=163 /DNA_ID=CAMNT_0011904019 /DNA_START=79 /DNA_END=566 /DNA_ORIENTATION=+